MLKYLRLLLFPFSILYGLVVFARNKLYDGGILKSVQFELPVICVGNLVVGGSGKSPVTEYLVHLLADYKIAILSRGYGRKTKGFILADQRATVETVGDEPMQFYNKFNKEAVSGLQVTVAVCEDRVYGIQQLKDQHDLIILDDAYQHRAVKPGFNILLFEYHKLLTRQFLLPAGNLREAFSGYKRAQMLLVTKAPKALDKQQEQQCTSKFPAKQLAFSTLKYDDLVSLYRRETKPCTALKPDVMVFLLTGIANPDPLVEHLSQFTTKMVHHEYPDHYQFGTADIEKLIKDYKRHPATEKIIITTEKDAQRLLNAVLQKLLLNLPVFYLPVKIDLRGGDKVTFDQKILDYVSITTRNRTIYKTENR